MTSRADLLAKINADLPNLDWKQGARDYVAAFCARFTSTQIEDFIFTKPLAALTPEDPEGSLTEVSSYLFNFASTIRLLALKRGSRVLDVACGGGWFSHWLRRLGYDARGIDISEDFVTLARKRLLLDPHLAVTEAETKTIFQVHDLEVESLPNEFHGAFDAVVLESCLHHFFDPIAALSHIRESLAPGGVVLILEGENRKGPIRDEYVQVMLETATLERPYPREHLIEVLEAAGIPHVEFLGSVPGFFAASAPLSAHMTQLLADSTEGSNVCVCALDAESLRRVAPSYPGKEARTPPAATTATSDAAPSEGTVAPTGPVSSVDRETPPVGRTRGRFMTGLRTLLER